MAISSRQFFTTKPRTIIEYMTLDLYHPAFGTLRYWTTQPLSAAYSDKVFASETYQPAAMSVKETLQDERNAISYEIQFGRVGSQVKEAVKLVDLYPLGWMTPVIGTVNYYLSTDLDNPHRPTVELSVGSLSMDAENVAITLDTANPRYTNVARRYNSADFPGTEVVTV